MRLPTLGFCSKVAFPVAYQGLFAYFLLLAGSRSSASAIMVLALLGLLLTVPLQLSARMLQGLPRFLSSTRPLLVAVFLSLLQTIGFLLG